MSRPMRVLSCLAVLAVLAVLGSMSGCYTSPTGAMGTPKASMAFQANYITVTLESLADPNPGANETVEIVIWKSDPGNQGSCQKISRWSSSMNLSSASSVDVLQENAPNASLRQWNVCVKVTYSDGTVKVYYGTDGGSGLPSSIDLNLLTGATDCPCSCC